jgi:hypothetical protein
MFIRDGLAAAGRLRRPWSRAGRSRPVLLSGAVVAAAGLVLGAAPAASGATTLAAGWHSFTPPIGDGLLYDIYAPGVLPPAQHTCGALSIKIMLVPRASRNYVPMLLHVQQGLLRSRF